MAQPNPTNLHKYDTARYSVPWLMPNDFLSLNIHLTALRQHSSSLTEVATHCEANKDSCLTEWDSISKRGEKELHTFMFLSLIYIFYSAPHCCIIGFL
jgi:hypothetical protein